MKDKTRTMMPTTISIHYINKKDRNIELEPYHKMNGKPIRGSLTKKRG